MTTQNTNEVGPLDVIGDSDNTPDRVIIRQDKNTNDVIAFLPDVPANPGYIMSYEHIGQHSEAALDYYHDNTVPATSIAVVSLINELKSIGYNVRLVKRLTRPYGGWAK